MTIFETECIEKPPYNHQFIYKKIMSCSRRLQHMSPPILLRAFPTFFLFPTLYVGFFTDSFAGSVYIILWKTKRERKAETLIGIGSPKEKHWLYHIITNKIACMIIDQSNGKPTNYYYTITCLPVH